MGKKVMAANSCPGTPSSSTNPLLTSTPSNLVETSPSSLSPLLQSGPHSQASPLAIAAALNQLKAAVAASPITASHTSTQLASGNPAPSSPLINLPSQQVVTALVNEALKGATTAQLTSSLHIAASPSHGSQLQNQCTSQPNTMSPLLKSLGAASPIGSGTAGNVLNGSPQVAKSPGPKIVTVSKLPPTMTTQNEQLSTLLQTLQQHAGPLLKATSSTNGSGPNVHQSESGMVTNGAV